MQVGQWTLPQPGWAAGPDGSIGRPTPTHSKTSYVLYANAPRFALELTSPFGCLKHTLSSRLTLDWNKAVAWFSPVRFRRIFKGMLCLPRMCYSWWSFPLSSRAVRVKLVHFLLLTRYVLVHWLHPRILTCLGAIHTHWSPLCHPIHVCGDLHKRYRLYGEPFHRDSMAICTGWFTSVFYFYRFHHSHDFRGRHHIN